MRGGERKEKERTHNNGDYKRKEAQGEMEMQFKFSCAIKQLAGSLCESSARGNSRENKIE